MMMSKNVTHQKSIFGKPYIEKRLKLVGYVAFLITSKVLDVRRRGATTEAYGVIRRKPAPAEAGGGAIEGNAAEPVPAEAGMMP
jgi:hypothetical protein